MLDIVRNQINNFFLNLDSSSIRIHLIEYSPAFRKILNTHIHLLRKQYSFYELSNFKQTNEQSSKVETQESIFSKIFKTLLGLIPYSNIGSAFSVFFLVHDVSKSLKQSDIDVLAKKIPIKSKQYKKYKKIKNIIHIDLGELSEEDIEYAAFIIELINRKYIINTSIIVQFSQKNINVFPSSSKLCLDVKELLEHNNACELSHIDEIVTIVNAIGIEYLSEIIRVYNKKDSANQCIAEKLIEKNILSLKESTLLTEEKIIQYLTNCSLLFQKFSLEDIQKCVDNKIITPISFANAAITSNVIKSISANREETFTFVQEYFRKMFQSTQDIKIKDEIYSYLNSRYYSNYTDIAFASKICSQPKNVILSKHILAFYHSKRNMLKNESEQIVSELVGEPLGELVYALDNAYINKNYNDVDIMYNCKSIIYHIEETHLDTEIKLVCLSYVAKVFYEIESNQEELKQVKEKYDRYLIDLKAFSEPKVRYSKYLKDYISFCTCIEDFSDNVLQKVSYELQKLFERQDLSIEKIKFYRLGNAIYHGYPLEAFKFTEKAFLLSKNYPYENLLASINYSTSLMICSRNKEALELIRTQKKLLDNVPTKNFLKTTILNNLIVCDIYSEAYKKVEQYGKELKSLINIRGNTSDQTIVKNNYLATQIIAKPANGDEIKKLATEILMTSDSYHCFYALQNLLVHYYMQNRKDDFIKTKAQIVIPFLLSGYKDFFSYRVEFLENNFGNRWNIQKLEREFIKYLNERHINTNVVYTRIILLGIIEHWFE